MFGKHYPMLEVSVDDIQNNTQGMVEFCSARGISVTGGIKFSDGDPDITLAYHIGRCAQIASSRTVHLRTVKEQIPGVKTLLLRLPLLWNTRRHTLVRYKPQYRPRYAHRT